MASVTTKKHGGFIFRTYANDHRPYHVHVFKDNEEIGRFDIEAGKPMGRLKLTRKLKKALRAAGYLI